MSHIRKVLQGSASNLTRVFVSMLVGLVLPPLLVHRLQPAEYSAWVLILQCGSYINLLDLGLQTAIGKFVAEYDAAGDRVANGRVLSSAFVILCASATAGAIAILLVAWLVPQIFHQMPVALIGEMRVGILAVGLSMAFALPFGAFLAAFTGLQRYGFPTLVALLSKGISSAALAAVVLMNGTLVELALTLAAFNVITALVQYWGWRRYARDRVDFHWNQTHRETAWKLARFGSVLSIWAVGVLFVSGLDIVIVGHYDYKNTGYYGIAASATNLMLVIIGAVFTPFIPAISSMQAGRTQKQLGDLTIKTARYCSLLIALFGTPLTFCAYPVLKLWVGADYAMHSAVLLQILVLGNAVRQFGYSYAIAVVATGKQHLATVATVTEAVVNVAVSIYLVQKIGAPGVAIGTLVGAFFSVGLHLVLSMRLTQSTIALSPWRYVLEGICRPMLSVVPVLLLIPMWKPLVMLPVGIPWMLAGTIACLSIAWFVGLTGDERSVFRHKLLQLSGWRASRVREANS